MNIASHLHVHTLREVECYYTQEYFAVFCHHSVVGKCINNMIGKKKKFDIVFFFFFLVVVLIIAIFIFKSLKRIL